MIEIFVMGGVLSLSLLGFILWPLFRQNTAPSAKRRESQLYQDQLAEVERDQERGVLNEKEATAARHEIERRLLGAARREAQAETGRSKPARAVIAGLTGLIPLLGGLLYLTLGSPGQPSAPFAARVPPLPPTAEDGEMVRLVQELETQLASRPDDIEGHILLARSYKNMGAYDQALPAYQKAVRLEGGNDPTLAGEYAEVMVITNGGQVPPDAVRLFTLINQNIPGDPQATYYLALAKAQAGDLSGAINDLEGLKAASLPNAPWRPGIDALLEELREDQATRRETNQ